MKPKDQMDTEAAALAEARDMLQEDNHGVWELLWGLNSALPSLERAERLKLAQQTLIGLLHRGEIELFLKVGQDREVPYRGPSADRLLLDLRNWEPPEPGATAVWFGAVEETKAV